MARAEIRRATEADARELALDLRAEDVAEVEAEPHEFGPAEALLESLRVSTGKSALVIDGRVAALWGAAPLEGDPSVGVVWLLGGNVLHRHRKTFARLSKQAVAALLEHFAELFNYVDERYTAAVRWLEWLGAVVYPAVPYGVNGELFHPFEIRRPA